MVVKKENLDKVTPWRLKEKLGQKWRGPKRCYFLKWIISWSLNHGVWMSGLAALHTWTARWDCKCWVCAARLIIRELSTICLQFRGNFSRSETVTEQRSRQGKPTLRTFYFLFSLCLSPRHIASEGLGAKFSPPFYCNFSLLLTIRN